MGRLGRLAKELRRRKVDRAAGVYLVMAFVTVQVVDAVFPALPLPEGADTLVVVLLAIGFPITIGLAWALELTPEGFRKELPAESAQEEQRVGEARPTRELRPDSIAVLPFENLSPDPENEYFSDGVTEDIIASIARIRGLRVLSRTSVVQYKDEKRPLSTVARELGVATIVTGSVRRSGGRIRIVAQVVDGRDEDHLWSDTYDRELGDVFQIQSEVAAQVAGAVRRELSSNERRGIEARGTSDPDAYDLYLRGRFLWNQRDEASVAEAVSYFRRAVERDADFALARAGLADAYTILGIYGARAPRDVFPAAREAAAAALAVDPKLGEALTSAACVRGVFDWDWNTAEAEFLHAIERAPSYPTAHQWYAMHTLVPQRRFEDALAALARAHDLDPASSAIAVSRGIVAYYSLDFERATRDFEAVEKHHPRFALVHYFLSQCHRVAGRREDSLAASAKAVELSRESSEALAAHGFTLAQYGKTDEAGRVLRRLADRSQSRYVSPTLLAQVLIGLGHTDEALDRLEAGVRARATDLIWLDVRPMYDTVREEPRFRSILSELGLMRSG